MKSAQTAQLRRARLRLRLAQLNRQAEELGKEILYRYVDRARIFDLQKKLREDTSGQGEKLLRNVQVVLIEGLTPDEKVEQALNRFIGLVKAPGDTTNAINQLSKILDLLGIKLTTGF